MSDVYVIGIRDVLRFYAAQNDSFLRTFQEQTIGPISKDRGRLTLEDGTKHSLLHSQKLATCSSPKTSKYI